MVRLSRLPAFSDLVEKVEADEVSTDTVEPDIVSCYLIKSLIISCLINCGGVFFSENLNFTMKNVFRKHIFST